MHGEQGSSKGLHVRQIPTSSGQKVDRVPSGLSAAPAGQSLQQEPHSWEGPPSVLLGRGPAT